MKERQRSRSVVWDWISCRIQVSSHALFVALEWAAIASSAQDDLEAADREGSQSGSSQLLTLMIETPGDLV